MFSKRPNKRQTLATVVVLFLALVVLDEWEKSQPKPVSAPASLPSRPLVSTLKLSPTQQQPMIRVLARVTARYDSQLISQVDGQVIYLNDNLLVGNWVEQDELLVAVDATANQAEAAAARFQLSQAQLALMEEKFEVAQAQRDWQHSELDVAPTSPLLLRQPQLQTAQHQVAAAEAHLARADKLLSDTEIRAPFRGVVIARYISPGEVLAAGQSVAHIINTEQLDVVVQIDQQQWTLLAEDWQTQWARLVDLQTQQSWSAPIRALGSVMDKETQLRNIYLSIKQPPEDAQALMPGKLVQVILPGKVLDDVILVPESAVTRDAFLWLVDDHKRLQKQSIELLASEPGYYLLRIPESGRDVYPIVLFPQSRFTVGQQVETRDYSQIPNLGLR